MKEFWVEFGRTVLLMAGYLLCWCVIIAGIICIFQKR